MIIDRIKSAFFFRILENARFGTLTVHLPHGEVKIFGCGEPKIKVFVASYEAIGLMFDKGSVGLGEAIMRGLVTCDDETALVQWVCRNTHRMYRATSGHWFGLLTHRLQHQWHKNTVRQAEKNICAHYDVGNDFYRQWLDQTMTYSAGIFHGEADDLQSAQLAKYDRIINTLAIKASDHVLEIGCGWGGFFTRAVERTGCRVTAVTISQEQFEYCQRHIVRQGLTRSVDLQLIDYRKLQGTFEKVVSIEMIEAVGIEYWPTYFNKISQCLKPGGQAVLQAITLRPSLFETYRRSTDFIQQFVFPGGALLTDEHIQKQGEDQGLFLEDKFTFGRSYALTLQKWRENFSAKREDLLKMGFSEDFLRLWHFYFSYCEGAFRAANTDVGQFLLTRS